MTPDRIDALADKLFAAAREERPERELVARVERAAASGHAATRAAEHGRDQQAGPRRRRAVVGGLLAAIVCGGVATLLLLPRARDVVTISAERPPGAVAARPGTLPSAPEGVVGREQGRGEAAPPRGAQQSAAEPDEKRPLPAAPSAPASDARRSTPGGAPRSAAPSTLTAPRDVPRGAPRDDARRATRATADEGAAAAPTATLSNELGVLRQIRQALRNGEGAAALALLDRYDGGEYGSSLALEATLLRVEALDASGRRAEAEQLARRFVRDNPDSPLAERAQRFVDRTEPERRDPNAQP